MGEAGPAVAAFSCCGAIWFIVSIFLLGFSFDTLDPVTMALKYNRNTLFLDPDTLYNQNDGESGRWFTGLGQAFVTFPRQLVRIKFNGESDADAGVISAKTFNGTSITMGLSLQYRLKRTASSVFSTYMKYGEDYHKFYAKYLRSLARDVISQHPVIDMWEKREAVGREMLAAFDEFLSNEGANVDHVQLLSLDIPLQIQSAIEDTTVAQQKIATAEFDKEAERVRANTRVFVAEKAADITVIQAQGSSKAVLLNAQAEAQALNVTIQAEIDSYAGIKSTFGFDNAKLMNYIWLDNVLASQAGKTYVSIAQPAETQIA